MDLISKPFCTVTLLTAGYSHLVSAVKSIFIRHIKYSNIYIIHNTHRLTLAKEDTALSKNSWEVLRGGGSIV